MILPFDPKSDDKVRSDYGNLSTWMNWVPEVRAMIDGMDMPLVMKEAAASALMIHGDCLLDLFQDTLTDAAHRAGYRTAMAEVTSNKRTET